MALILTSIGVHVCPSVSDYFKTSSTVCRQSQILAVLFRHYAVLGKPLIRVISLRAYPEDWLTCARGGSRIPRTRGLRPSGGRGSNIQFTKLHPPLCAVKYEGLYSFNKAAFVDYLFMALLRNSVADYIVKFWMHAPTHGPFFFIFMQFGRNFGQIIS